MTRAEILKAAERCVCTDRNQQYGEPEDNFRTISMLWSVYLCARGMEHPLGAADVGAMMALFKLGRIATGGDKTGCAIREAPDLRAALDMIQQYEST